MTPLLTPEEKILLERNKDWMKVVLGLWGETREYKKRELTEYGYYYDLYDMNIITMDEFDKLTSMIDE